jgi:hypothetical protein
MKRGKEWLRWVKGFKSDEETGGGWGSECVGAESVECASGGAE